MASASARPVQEDLDVETLPSEWPMYELLRIKKVDELCDPVRRTWTFETALVGYSLFPRPAVYGGISLGVGIQAAFETLFEELGEQDASEFRAYSYQGSFLGPASAKYALRITVTSLRSTRSFVTRLITLSQKDPANPSARRNIVSAICDFARRGRTPLVEYHAPALNPVTGKAWERPNELEIHTKLVDELIDQAEASNDDEEYGRALVAKAYAGLWDGFIELKLPKDSLMNQSYWLTHPELPSTQDHLPITERVMVDWFRVVPDLSEASAARISAERPDCVPFRPIAIQTTCLTFVLDQLLPLTAIVISKTPRTAAAHDISLDFSIRFHREDGLDVNKWSFRQFKSLTASAGRSFTQATLWDEDGHTLASISQQGHCCPAPPPRRKQASSRL
ncbi:hypothetical protein CF326_g3169 [Tilletia indica]|nr:hypothetical protein CF326_g3169 [Tilletia indica]